MSTKRRQVVLATVVTTPLCAVCGKPAGLEVNLEAEDIPVCSAECAYNLGRRHAPRLIGKVTRSARRR